MAVTGAEPRPFVAEKSPALRGEAGGEGRPIVLCHGLTATRRSVLHGSHALERAGHRVVLYDARGHGESDPAPAAQGYDYPALVADLEAVVDSRAGTEPVIVGGHSMGAHTAIAYPLRNPGRVAGLVAIGPSYTGAEAGSPNAKLTSEEEGRSPLAWQGGRLSRAIAAFAAGL
jgi:3-oxoadipate enol-lactonase